MKQKQQQTAKRTENKTKRRNQIKMCVSFFFRCVGRVKNKQECDSDFAIKEIWKNK